MRLANQDWDLSLMEGIIVCSSVSIDFLYLQMIYRLLKLISETWKYLKNADWLSRRLCLY